jgi:hypothetical protein
VNRTSVRFAGGGKIQNPLGTGSLTLVLLAGIFISACATSAQKPREPDDICTIFRENRKWYHHASRSQERWHIPVPTLMAIIYRESGFVADARPPRGKCLWVLPWFRPTSAFGYAQACDAAWEEYIRSTGNSGADRDDFEDAVDFVGWFSHLSSRRCGISRKDAFNLYLAYHEGHGGFNRKSYAGKAWLLKIAARVERRARRYEKQFALCEKEFREAGRSCLWPF